MACADERTGIVSKAKHICTDQKQPQRVYIAGKITGEPIHTATMKFGEAQMKLQEKGYNVVNPLAVVNDWRTPWKQAMKLCIPALMECDAIYLLPDWQESRGATMEAMIAKTMEMPFIKL